MPYVSRRQQPFSLLTAGNRSLIGWYDNSNALYGPNTVLTGNTLIDKGAFQNNLTSQLGFTTISSNFGFRKFAFSSSNYYINSDRIEIKDISVGLTFFFVGAAGYTLDGNSLINIYGNDILSINSNNGINILGSPTGRLIANGNNNILLSGYITDSSSILYINGNEAYSLGSGFTDKTTFQKLYIGSSNNIFNTNTLANINTNINSYLDNDGSNIYPNSLNSVNEVLIYNSVLNSTEIENIHTYLLEKWNTVSYNYNALQTISHLITWYDLSKSSSIYFPVSGSPQAVVIYDSGGLNNNIWASDDETMGGVGYPTYDSINYLLDFNNINSVYRARLFTGTGYTTGFTISLVVQNNINNIASGTTIINIKSIDGNRYGPTIIMDDARNIYGVLDNSLILDISSNPICTGFENNSDLYILTAQFQDYGTYQTSQIFINGRSMQILSKIDLQWINSNFNSYDIKYGGNIDDILNQISCDTKLGETIIYKKILNNDELYVIHNHLSSRYNIDRAIEPKINTDIEPNINTPIRQYDLLWLDIPEQYSDGRGTRGTILETWTSKTGEELTNTNNTILVREYMGLRVLDFNNGPLSPLGYSNDTIGANINENFYTLFIVIILNPQQITNEASLFYTQDINNSIDIKLNYNEGLWYVTLYHTKSGNEIKTDIQTNINIDSLVNIIVVKALGSAFKLYTIPTINSIGTSGNIIGGLGEITTIRIGDNCKHNIGEIMMYNRQLNLNEEVNILSYLQSKWKIPIIINFPNDYIFWFDPDDIDNITWTSKDAKYKLTYSDTNVFSEPTQIIDNVKFYNANSFHNFINTDVINCSGIINPNSSYTYFIVHNNGGGLFEDAKNIFSIVCGSNKLQLELRTTSAKTYPVMYRNNEEITIEAYNNLISNNTIYITCVSYDTQYTVVINTKGSSSEINNVFNAGQFQFTYNDDDNLLLSIGGKAFYDNFNYNGLIGDFIFYSRTLNDIEKLRVIQYLEAKYSKLNA